ncbi:MAG: Txe/YoeB family addiction module toxin [Spirochaetaceae bacterium]|nr:Txe/YoeB family addiction module toxin [Spirochaetaceae bacterium]MBQ7367495.1 Txe/YoeB family addiction module toxin [Spirochaetaceae bacterium]MBQ8561389.1 Txe/YoeB family addiction module toxin [Spirochaetaceae bacterium]MBR2463400.1 Txe/YoeB family addiction module toxin [Spirochaetaceae bacterium]
MQKNWSDIAWEDYLRLQSDKRLLKRANEILKDIDRNGYSGIGKPEPLKGDFSGYWSRRIDECHRIVYKILGDVVYIAYCGTHYHK